MSTTIAAENLKKSFREHGYVKVPGFFSEDEIEAFRQGIIEASSRLPTPSSLNKDNMIFYSNVFLKSAAIRSLISQSKVIDLVCAVGAPDLWVRWDQCVAKAPGGAEFPWHQDNAYNRLKDEHYQLWIAITDMTLENGGLWLQPGSQKQRWPHEKIENHMVSKVRFGEEVFCSAKKGDVIVFSSLMLHHTKKNTSNSDRWAYVVEYMSLDHYDPLVGPPFFVVAENGVPCPRFAETYRGHARRRNRLKYLPLLMQERSRGLRSRMRERSKRLRSMIAR